MWEKWGLNQWFCSCKKSFKFFEKLFFKKKKKYSTLFLQIWSAKWCTEIFVNKWVLKYLSFSDFKVLKIVLHHKIINKDWSTKSQENSAHHFVGNYLTNHIAKFLQDRIKPWRVYLNKHFISEQDFFLIGIRSNQD